MLVRPNEQATSGAQIPLCCEKVFLSLAHKVKVVMSNGKGYLDTVCLS